MAGAGKMFKIAFKLDAMLNKNFGKTFDAAEERLSQVGDKLTSVGKGLSLGVTAPLVGLAALSLRTGADFENSMGSIQARTGMTAEKVGELGGAFREMALDGGFTAREISSAFSDIALAGQDVGHGTEIMRHSMVLANAVGDELAGTAYFLGNYLQKVGKDASYAERYINLFAAANQRTQMPLSTLQDYLFRANAALNAARISGTEATAVFSELYSAGVRGANAYSGFQQAIETIMLPTEAQNAAFRRLGIATDSLEWQSKSTMEQFFALGDAMAEVTDGTEQLSLMNTLFTQQSARAFADELFNQRDALRDIIPELYEVSGALDGTGLAFEMAAIQQDGLSGSARQVRATLEEIQLQVSEQLMPHIQSLLNVVGVWIQRFANLDEGTQRIVFIIIALAAALGPVLIILGKMFKAVAAVRGAYVTLKTTLAAVKTATALATAAKVADTQAAGFNTIATNAANAASAARKVAKTAEANALKLSAKAEAIAATAGKGSAAATAAATAAEKARTAAKAAAVVASQKVTAADALRATATKASTTATLANTKAIKANALASSTLGKIIAKVAGASKILIVITKAKTVAFALMSKAIMAIPVFGWILAGITAIIAIGAALFNFFGRAREEYVALAEEAETLRNRQENLTAAAANSAAEFERNTRVMQVAGQAYTELADRVQHLTEMQNHNLTERARLAEEAIVLELELYDVTAMREELEAKINDGTRRNRRSRNALNDALNDLIAAEEAYLEALNANASQIETVNSLYEDNARALEEIARAQEQAMIETYGFEMAMRRQAFTAEEWANAQEQALDKMNRSFENYKRMTTNAFDTVNERAAVSVAELTTNLLQNAQMVEEWSKNMAILTERGLDEGLIEQLRQAGPEAAATVRGLVDAADYELEALNYAFGESTRVAVESMQRELDPGGVTESAEELIDLVAITILENSAMENALISKVNEGFRSFNAEIASVGFDDSGHNMMASTARGIHDGTGELVVAMREAARRAVQAMRDELEMSSPSKQAVEIGEFFMDGLAIGICSKYGVIEDACKGAANVMRALYVPGGYGSASSAHSVDGGFGRYGNLFPSGDSAPTGAIGTLKRMGEASNYHGGSASFSYTAPSITINGSGHDVDELRGMILEVLKNDRASIEAFVYQCLDKKQTRERRLANG